MRPQDPQGALVKLVGGNGFPAAFGDEKFKTDESPGETTV
jgi:hypothetical protein